MINGKVIVLDISFWQDDDYTPYKVDFEISWRNGADGVILRAGQNTWFDEDFLDYADNAQEINFPWGAYWFFDSRSSPIPQADLFADIIENSGFPPLGIWGDYEENYGGVYGGEANFKRFMNRLRERFPNKMVGVYTGPDYWKTHTTAAGRAYFESFPLWIANYGVVRPEVPYPWTDRGYVFWQFSAEGDGESFGAESREIDMNFFYGSLEDYKSLFNIPNYEPFQPIQGDTMYNCKVKSTVLPYANLRDTPMGDDIGDLYPNEEFQADGMLKDAQGRDWLHSIKAGKVGYVLASLCDYTLAPQPNPQPTGLPATLYIATKEDMSDKTKYVREG